MLKASRNLDEYIGSILKSNNGELFSLPSFVHRKDFVGFTLQSIIVFSDIWTLRTTAFLSLASKPPPEKNDPIVTVSRKAKVSEWIHFSKYIPASPRYVENLFYIHSQIANLIQGSDEDELKIQNNVLYYIADVRQLMDYKSLQDWENRHLDDYNLLKSKSDRGKLDISRLREILKDIPITDEEDPLNVVRRRSGLYVAIMGIFDRIKKLDTELDRALRSKTLDVDRLRYISDEIENGIPRNSPIKNTRYRKVLAYCTFLESYFTRKAERLKIGCLMDDLSLSAEEELHRDFSDLFGIMDRLRDGRTMVDHILGLEIGVRQEEGSRETGSSSLALDLDGVWTKDLRQLDSSPKRCIVSSVSSRLITGRVTSRRIRSTMQELSRLRRWESMVNNSFDMLRELEKMHSLYKKLSRTNGYHTIRDIYRRLLSVLETFESKTNSFIEYMTLVVKIFEDNRDFLSRSKVIVRYKRVLDAFTRVRELEGFLEKESDPNFRLVLFYLDNILGSKLCLFPRRRSQAVFLERLESYISFENYVTRSLETKQTSFRDLVILDKYLSLRSEKYSQSEVECNPSVFQDFDSLLYKLLDKTKESFYLASRIHFMLSSFGDDPDLIFSGPRYSLDFHPIIRYLIESEDGFETTARGFLSYLETAFDSSLGFQSHQSDDHAALDHINGDHPGGEERRLLASHGYGFSLESYRKLFLDVVRDTDLYGDLYISEQEDLKVAIIVPPSYRVRLIQRYYVIEALMIVANRHSLPSCIQDLVVETVQSGSMDTLVTIWRSLRLLDAGGSLFEDMGRLARRLDEEDSLTNDVLYSFIMKHLTDTFSKSFLWKRSVFGSIDDYLMDMEFITESGVLGESEKRHFVSEASEIRELASEIQQIIQKLNSDNFSVKKRIIGEILGWDLESPTWSDDPGDLKQEDRTDIYVHQPLSYEEDEIRERLLSDFPAKRRNEFFLRIHIEDLFHQDSVSIIRSESQNVLTPPGNGGSLNSRRDKCSRNFTDLVEEYLRVVEDERNRILLVLGKSSRFQAVPRASAEEEERRLSGLKSLFRDLVEETGTISSSIILLNHLVSDLMHLEVSFITQIVKVNQTSHGDAGPLIFREWFNDNYLRDKSPYRLFRGIRVLSEMTCCAATLSLFGLIREVSVKYLEIVEDWDRSYSRIFHKRRSSEFYDILLAYSRCSFLKRVLGRDLDSVSPPSKLCGASRGEGVSYKEKCEFIDKEYRRLKILLGDFMLPFKRHMNEIFDDISANGLYGVKSSTRFLFCFPSCLIEILRSKDSSRHSDSTVVPIFVEDISVVYFSRELSLLLVKVNINYRSEHFYLSPGLLVCLSNEIDLGSGILEQSLLVESYSWFVHVYRDSFVKEHYYYIKQDGVTEDLADHVNMKLVDFEKEVRLKAVPSRSEFGRSRRRKFEISLEPFKIDGGEDKNKSGMQEKNRLIVISDIIDLTCNILLYRIFVSGLLTRDGLNGDANLFRRDISVLDLDLALKSLIMCFSMRELVDMTFPRVRGSESVDSLFVPPELFGVLRELSVLYDMLNREDVLIRIQNRPVIHHHIFEREQMLMEDFRTWEVASDRYLFKMEARDSKETLSTDKKLFLSRVIWIPEYENFSTILEVVDLILLHVKRIKSLLLDPQDIGEVSELVKVLEVKRVQILELEESSVRILRGIKDDESLSCQVNSESEPFFLIEKTIPPPRTSQKTVCDSISRRISEIAPDFKFINKTLSILPYKGFEILTKYFEDSALLDKSISLTMIKIADLEKLQDIEARQDVSHIMSHNLEYVSRLVELRKLMSTSVLASDILYKAYLKFSRGIIRYFLIYGSRSRWARISEFQDPDKSGVQEGRKEREVFVPIMEYTVLRKIYKEFLLWYKYSSNEEYLLATFYNCEFIMLESLLSCCKHLMESISYNLEKRESEYLVNHCILRYLYYRQEGLDENQRSKILSPLIGLLDIGQYLTDYLDLLEKELIVALDYTRKGNSSKLEDLVEIGSSNVFSKADNRLIHHFLRKNKVQVSISGSVSTKYGLLSNIYYIYENKEKVIFGWPIVYISQPLNPVNGACFIRRYVRQYLDYIFKAFYGKNDQDYIKKKNHILYSEALPKKEEISLANLFRVLDCYLKKVMNYSLSLIQKSFRIKSSEDHLSYSNLSIYPDHLEMLRNKWLVFEEEDWISKKMRKNLSHIQAKPESSRGRVKDERKEEALDKSNKSRVLLRDAKCRQSKRERTLDRDLNGKVGLEKKSRTFDRMESNNIAEEKGEEEKTQVSSSRKARENHQGLRSSLNFVWLGWLGFGSNHQYSCFSRGENRHKGEEEEEILEIGLYQVSRQFTKKSEEILKELDSCTDLRYNGVKHSKDIVKRALGGNSMVVLISSNWSQHLGSCKSQVFSRIFYYNYDYGDYEIFEFEVVDREKMPGEKNASSGSGSGGQEVPGACERKLVDDIRLLIFPCNLNEDEETTKLLPTESSVRRGPVPLPISKYYLIGMVVLKSEISQDHALGQVEDEEISMVTGLLPNEEQMKKLAQYCHNVSFKSESKMEFLINNGMFLSAKTLLSSLLSLRESCYQGTQSSGLNEQGRNPNSINTLQDLANSMKQNLQRVDGKVNEQQSHLYKPQGR